MVAQATSRVSSSIMFFSSLRSHGGRPGLRSASAVPGEMAGHYIPMLAFAVVSDLGWMFAIVLADPDRDAIYHDVPAAYEAFTGTDTFDE